MAEIDDKTLAELQGAYKIASALMSNPKTKERAQALVKEIAPNAPLPEHDIRTDVNAKLAEMQKTLDGFIKGQKEKGELDTYQRDFDAAVSKYGITEEGQKKMLDLMKDRQIRDPEAGALLFNAQNPPSEPITSSPWASTQMFDTGKDSELASWFSDPAKKRDEEIRNVFSERR